MVLMSVYEVAQRLFQVGATLITTLTRYVDYDIDYDVMNRWIKQTWMTN